MDGWNTILSYWVSAYFQGRTGSFRECIFFIFTPIWGRFPIWLIFFRWVEPTNQFSEGLKNLSLSLNFEAQIRYLRVELWRSLLENNMQNMDKIKVNSVCDPRLPKTVMSSWYKNLESVIRGHLHIMFTELKSEVMCAKQKRSKEVKKASFVFLKMAPFVFSKKYTV